MSKDFTIPIDDDKERELPPPGLHNAVCAYVEDLGMQEKHFGGEKTIKHEIALGFELEPRMEDGRRFLLTETVTLSLHEKAKLRKVLKEWRGRDLSEEERRMGKVQIGHMIGVGATVNVVHNESRSNGKTYANLGSILPKQSNAEALTVELESIPDWIREKQKEGGVNAFGTSQDTTPGSDAGDSEIPF